ncbi:MAG TPA: protoporphyrinogen oxidase [Terriglobales bacterium]|jgi:oxygen-dependent protoporphyrinogen oxidase|nr:protoporphyrinogen oxidase [Terriglobales bacterium]
MKRIAIVGGGISGLAAAFALEERRRAGEPLQYVVFEAAPRLGGVLVTEQVDGCLLEAGPDSFLTEKPWAADLCRRLGLEDQLIGSNDGERKTYIVVKGRLTPIPDGLMFMVPTSLMPTFLSPLFSPSTKLRMAREWRCSPRKSNGDESVAALVERHYGAEMVDRVADPMLSGVYGGEASQLSVRAVLPRFAEMEAKYGSLSRGMLAARKNAKHGEPAPPIFTSLKNGMQQLADTVVANLPPEFLHANSPVQAVQRQDRGWVVSAGYASDHFDAVILATPAPMAALLLEITSAELAAELRTILYSSSVTVALGFDQNVRTALPPGFGFLVPRREGRRMLATTFVHNKFPHRAPQDRALLRCFLGGSRDPQVLQLSDEEILNNVRDELYGILGLSAEPLFSRVYRWKSAMAQYNVGHLERVQRIENLRKQLPGLALAGNAYRGIGVPDCVRSGQEAVAELFPIDG